MAFDDLPAWAAWLAQDEDGTWWAYEAEPNKQDHGWYENEVGRILRLGRTAPPADWEATLEKAGERRDGVSPATQDAGEASSCSSPSLTGMRVPGS